MHIQRLLQICVAAQSVLVTFMLSMGQQQPTLSVLSLVVASSSVYFTDITGWLRLRGKWANLAAAAALGVSFWDLQRYGVESRLLALANLLIYLQFVLLYQKKQVRTYWLLHLINLQIVAVAAALNSDLAFGFLLVVYVALALCGLTLLFVHSESERQASAARQIPPQAILASATPADDKFAPLSNTNTADPGAPRWPLPLENEILYQPPVVPALRDVLVPAVVRLGSLLVGTFALAAVIFVIVPRPSRPEEDDSRFGALGATSQIGATPEVKLGLSGPLFENTEGVMRIRFFDAATNQPYVLTGEPLLRGYVLTRYANGTWQQEPFSNPRPLRPLDPIHLRGIKGLVRQEIIMEPFYTNVLFCVYPIRGVLSGSGLQFDAYRRNLIREPHRQRSRFTFSLLTSGFEQGRPVRLMPCPLNVERFADLRQVLTHVPEPTRRTVANIARRVVDNIPPEDRMGRALALQRYFTASGRFQYTLNRPRRNDQSDPVVDFLLRDRRGHCEYFASALAIMLRTQGIPARMVVGYKGGEWNSLGGFYQVRQLHAHAWVEAFLAPEHLPPSIDAHSLDWSEGAWLVLDPTPQVGASLATSRSWFNFTAIRQLIDYLQFVWSSYIMGMDYQRQQQNIYEPALRAAIVVAQNVSNRAFWHTLANRVWQFLTDGKWFSWQAGLIGMAVTAVLIIFWRMGTWCTHIVRGWIRRGRRAVARRRAEVEFFRRLEKILARARMHRPPGQTPREFAQHVHARLCRADPPVRRLASVAPQVVEAYYQVRFGRQHLDKRQLEAVEQSLDELEVALRAAARRQRWSLTATASGHR